MMRRIDENGKAGFQAARDAIGDQDSLLIPGESWASRTVLDAKIAFILAGLEHQWPEV